MFISRPAFGVSENDLGKPPIGQPETWSRIRASLVKKMKRDIQLNLDNSNSQNLKTIIKIPFVHWIWTSKSILKIDFEDQIQ